MGANSRQIRVHVLDAFTDEPLAGNAAGVVPDASGLSETQMQAIARELAVSETAFLTDSDEADRRIRYFTPTQEVDLCGHATIATHAHLFDDGVVEAGSHTLETNVGVLDVEVEADGMVWMTQDWPEVSRVDVGYDRLGDVLGVDESAFEGVGADLPPAVASTGLPFLVVPVDYLEQLGRMEPDFAAVERLSEELDAVGVYAFTFDTVEHESTLHGRAFVPLAGVSEDPVTGTASGATGGYLREFDAFDAVPETMVFEQGHFVDRPGYVRVEVAERVRVGGRATAALDGHLAVPEDDDPEIIEV